MIKGVRKNEYLDLVFQNLRTAAFASVRPLIRFPLDDYPRDDTTPQRPSPRAEFTEDVTSPLRGLNLFTRGRLLRRVSSLRVSSRPPATGQSAVLVTPRSRLGGTAYDSLLREREDHVEQILGQMRPDHPREQQRMGRGIVGLTHRRRPAAALRRAGKGSYVLIVGPDGCGKSTLARKLIEERRGDHAKVLHVHWRPGLLPRPGGLVGVKAGDPTDPHGQEPHGRVLSYALLAYNWLDFFLGMWLRIVPVRANGGLVVMERGWMDIAVDPRRYHLAVSSKLVESLGRLLPSPDLVIVLEADPRILRDRKPELPLGELARQIGRWRAISFSGRTKRLVLDASQEPGRLLDQVTHALSVM